MQKGGSGADEQTKKCAEATVAVGAGVCRIPEAGAGGVGCVRRRAGGGTDGRQPALKDRE